jgi:hypothetical protein
MKRRNFFKVALFSFSLPTLINANAEQFTFSKSAKSDFATETSNREEIPFSLNVVIPAEAGFRVGVTYSQLNNELPKGEHITEVLLLPTNTKYGRGVKTNFENPDAIIFQKSIVEMMKTGYLGVIALTNKNHYMAHYQKVIISAHGCGE